MYSCALTSKGQVTIPNQIRKKLKLHPGDKVGFLIENDHVVLVRRFNKIEAAFGLVKSEKAVSLEDIERAIRKGGSDDRS